MEQKNIEAINEESQNKKLKSNDSLVPIEGETSEETAARFAANYKFSNNKAIRGIEKFFKFDTLGAIMKKEIIGGLATFLSLVYILSVQPGLVSGTGSIADLDNPALNMNYFGIFFATAIASGVGCMFMGLFANVPVAVSTTMGINTLVAFTVGNAGGLGYEGALIVTMISSILFVTLSLTPLRSKILRVIPREIILAIGIGIGVFISYIGFQGMGWFSTTPAGPALGDLSQNWLAIVLGMTTLAIILILSFRKIPGAVAIGIIAMFAVALVIANVLPSDSHWLLKDSLSATGEPIKVPGFLHDANFKQNGGWEYDFDGLISNWDHTFSAFKNMDIWNNPIFYVSIFIILLMNFFDATGTLATFTHQLNKNTNQHHEISNKAMIVDASGTMVASLMGTTPLGTFVESSVGIQQGARTGFAAIINGLLFFIAIALFPVFKAIPQCITGAACVYIGIMLFKEAELVQWTKIEFVVPTFLTVVFMIASYEIANGIAIGFISYAFMMIITKKGKEVNWIMYLLAALFIAYFIAFAFVQ